MTCSLQSSFQPDENHIHCSCMRQAEPYRAAAVSAQQAERLEKQAHRSSDRGHLGQRIGTAYLQDSF